MSSLCITTIAKRTLPMIKYRAPSFRGSPFASLLNEAFNAVREAFRLSAAAESVIGRAGPGNTSKYVYEVIDGREYLFKAIEGNESLELLPSDYENDAQNHWNLFGHGSLFDWNQSVSHMYREGMFVMIRASENSYRLYVVSSGASTTQLRVNPSQRNIDPTDVVYIRTTFLS